MSEELLKKKIKEKSARIAVIGLGHVGLTAAAIFAEAGFRVIGCDIRKEVVDVISSGRSHINELGLNGLIRKAVERGKLRATTNTLEATEKAYIEVICVQTPVTNKNKPDTTFVEKACNSIASSLSEGKLVIVESTVPPGTTKNTVANLLERGSHLKCGRDFWLAHCPERITVGNAVQDFVENARIVGGYDPKSTEVATLLYRAVTKGQILVTDSTSAEMAKLGENAYRYVNIAFANQLAQICEHLGVDVIETIRLANAHPRVNIHKPGPGVGGPCLSKDTRLLLHSAKENGFRSEVIESSLKINEHMPMYAVSLLVKALSESGKNMKHAKVVVLGSAYRGEIDDATNSPAEKVIHELLNLKVDVVVYDPHCKESFGAKKIENLVEGAIGADALLVVTDHTEFKELDLEAIKSAMNKKPVIVDSRRVIDPAKATKKGFKYVGIGFHLK